MVSSSLPPDALSPDDIVAQAIIEKARREKLKRSGPAIEQWKEFAPQTKIRSGKKIIPFFPYPHQQLLHQIINSHYGTVIAKTRQLGITEYVGNRFLWKAKDPGFAAALFSKNQDDTNDIARRVRQMVPGSGVELENDSLGYAKIKDGGQLYFRPGSENAGRGLPSIAEILYDEAAHNKEAESIYSASISSTEMLGDDARIIINSTPNGKLGFFYGKLMDENPDGFNLKETIERVRAHDLYSNNLPGFYWFVDKGGWAKVFIHWSCHPIYRNQKDFVEIKRRQKKMTKAMAEREYNLSFDDSDTQVFNPDLIKLAMGRGPDRPEPWKPNRRYIAGIDPNQGKSDNFTLVIYDVTSMPIRIADWLYISNRPVTECVNFAINKLKAYRPREIRVEVNSNKLTWEKIQAAFKFQEVIQINTTQNNKNTNTDRLVFLTEQENLVLPNLSWVEDEFCNFQQDPETKKRGAAYGFFDDFVMASAVCLAEEDNELSPLQALLYLTGAG